MKLLWFLWTVCNWYLSIYTYIGNMWTVVCTSLKLYFMVVVAELIKFIISVTKSFLPEWESSNEFSSLSCLLSLPPRSSEVLCPIVHLARQVKQRLRVGNTLIISVSEFILSFWVKFNSLTRTLLYRLLEELCLNDWLSLCKYIAEFKVLRLFRLWVKRNSEGAV